jgi:hypothetical protein
MCALRPVTKSLYLLRNPRAVFERTDEFARAGPIDPVEQPLPPARGSRRQTGRRTQRWRAAWASSYFFDDTCRRLMLAGRQSGHSIHAAG